MIRVELNIVCQSDFKPFSLRSMPDMSRISTNFLFAAKADQRKRVKQKRSPTRNQPTTMRSSASANHATRPTGTKSPEAESHPRRRPSVRNQLLMAITTDQNCLLRHQLAALTAGRPGNRAGTRSKVAVPTAPDHRPRVERKIRTLLRAVVTARPQNHPCTPLQILAHFPLHATQSSMAIRTAILIRISLPVLTGKRTRDVRCSLMK